MAALALSLLASFLILNAAAIWGLGQPVAAGPVFVLVFAYITLLPLVFGAVGLFRTTPLRRYIAAVAILLSLTVYMFVADGYSFDWI